MNHILNHKCVCKKCELKTNRKYLVAEGPKTKYKLVNNEGRLISKYIVDDCLLQVYDRTSKCDFLVTVTDLRQAIFIECKGSDVLKAIKQLNSSIDILAKEFNGFSLKGRIIPTKVYSPDLITADYKKLRNKLRGQLEVKNNIFQESI